MMAAMDARVRAVAALADPVRRACYDVVVADGGDVPRAVVAERAGIPRTVAAFHLERLVRDGLLEVSSRRISGRSGPGAGRPARLYRRAEGTISVSLPPRNYQLAADLLAATVEETGDEEIAERIARRVGERIGSSRDTPVAIDGMERVGWVLAGQGFEPYVDEHAQLRLRNCAFHAIQREHPVLVCSMNRSFCEGVAVGVGVGKVSARIDPRPGECCVVMSQNSGRRRST
jgi:predicted ArsR family transcriptional regulator